MLAFKILNMCCTKSSRISAIVLGSGALNILSKWIPNKKKNDLTELDKAFHSELSDASDLEEFKIGSGGAATTSFHMQRKNSNVRMSDLAGSEDSVHQKEILNLLHTLLSVVPHSNKGKIFTLFNSYIETSKNKAYEESKQSEDLLECK